MRPLVIIPARGGSKGVPNKNIKKLNGKPLIGYTIEAAKEVFNNEHICVSTDDLKIKETVKKMGLKVPFIRPSELATDTASSYEVLFHALSYYKSVGYEPNTIVLLQPTSPFRTAKHIRKALEIYSSSFDMVVSVKETKANPYFVLFEENEEGFLNKSKESNFIRRQDCPKVWEYNGAIYIINVESLNRTTMHKFARVKKYVMDEMSSHDIDSMLDWRIAVIIAEENLI